LATANNLNAISKILTAIDGSQPSMRAANYAILLARKLEVQLWVVHMERDVGYVNPYSFGVYDLITTGERRALLNELMKDTKEWFDMIKATAEQNRVKLAKAELVVSSASDDEAIVDYAKRNSIGVVIIGMQGRSGLKRLILGNVASGVINHAHCPVMVVK
jgi:nucleotide-binding universal stress UspA family protein